MIDTRVYFYNTLKVTQKVLCLLNNSPTNEQVLSQVTDWSTLNSQLSNSKFRAIIYSRFSIKRFGQLTSP